MKQMKNVKLLSYLILVHFKICTGEYVMLNKHPKTTPCENEVNTALVEHFFNMVFSELMSNPPLCVCVQMCHDFPIYCYPNGCLKKTLMNKKYDKVPPISRIQKDDTTKSAMFLVNDDKRVVTDIIGDPSPPVHEEKSEKSLLSGFLLGAKSLKEIMSKYRKLPKLEMRYNLREQVKNMKFDRFKSDSNIDVSKTRWPSNKYLFKQSYNLIRRKNDDMKRSNYFASMYPDQSNVYSSVDKAPSNTKKYLTKRHNEEIRQVDNIYLYKTDTGNFSVEALIDSIILNTIDDPKNILKHNLNKLENDTEIVSSKEVVLNITNNVNKIEEVNMTDLTTNVNDVVKSTDNNQDTTSLHTKIVTVSKEIDNQNKISLNLMKSIIGSDFNIDNIEFTTTVLSKTPATFPSVTIASLPSTTTAPLTVKQDIYITPQTTTVPSTDIISNYTKYMKSHKPVLKRSTMKNKSTPNLLRRLQRKKPN